MVRLIGLRCVSFRDGARRSVGSSGRRPGLLDDIGAVKQGELGARPKWDKLAFGMNPSPPTRVIWQFALHGRRERHAIGDPAGV